MSFEPNLVRCNHTWWYLHSVFEGRSPLTRASETGVARWCEKCGKKQMAFTSAWIKPPKNYDFPEIESEKNR